jgi:hypothetical protein
MLPAIVPDAAMIGRFSAASMQPRLTANLATRVGGLIVSVRQAYAADRVRSMFESGGSPGTVGVVQVVLQINSGSADPSRADIDLVGLRGQDDRGTPLRPVHDDVPITGPVPIAGGRTFTVFLSAPHPAARTIQSLTGSVVEVPDGQRRAFLLRDIPLPGSPRLFGEVTPLTIRPDRLGTPGPRIALGTAVEAMTAGAQSDPSATSLPYLRLVLPDGVATDLNGVLPAGASRLSLVTSSEADGNIALTVRLGSAVLRARVWDREPFLVALPQTADGRVIGLLIQISRSDQIIALPAARSAFPGTGRSPAGSLVVRFLAGSRPIGPGLAPFRISRWEADHWSAPQAGRAPLRANGQAVMSNLRAGRYRIAFEPGRLTPLGALEGRPIAEYILHRYGYRQARWTGGVRQDVDVPAGGRTYGRPVQLEPLTAAR